MFKIPIPSKNPADSRWIAPPTCPTTSLLVISNKPVLNIISNAAVIARPELKTTDPNPSAPRSLSAFPVQLNHGDSQMLIAIIMKPNKGAIKPKNPANLSTLRFITEEDA